MLCIKIDFFEYFGFLIEIFIYIGYINYGYYFDNVVLILLVFEVWVCFFKVLGYSELDIEGVGIVVVDVVVQYCLEVFYGEILVIEMVVDDFSKYGCDLVWWLSDKVSGCEVVCGKYGIIFFDYSVCKFVVVFLVFVVKVGG